jgi:DNA-binding Lrp family transcriptional regulator
LGSKGYRAEEGFEKIILQVLPRASPLSYSEIWRRSNNLGIGSKETLSKYLTRLEKAGFVIRDGNGYRRSPLYDYPRLRQIRKSLGKPSEDWQYSYFWTNDFTKPSKIPQGDFLAMIQNEFNMVFAIYTWMITKLIITQDKEAAQELVGIFLRSQINPVLNELARDIWISRRKLPDLKLLKEKKLVFTDR